MLEEVSLQPWLISKPLWGQDGHCTAVAIPIYPPAAGRQQLAALITLLFLGSVQGQAGGALNNSVV